MDSTTQQTASTINAELKGSKNAAMSKAFRVARERLAEANGDYVDLEQMIERLTKINGIGRARAFDVVNNLVATGEVLIIGATHPKLRLATIEAALRGTETGTPERRDAIKAAQRARRVEALVAELRRRAELLELTPVKPVADREPLESLEAIVRANTSGYGRKRVETLARRMQETGLGLWHTAFELDGNDGRGCDCRACKDGRTDAMLAAARELADERNNEQAYAEATGREPECEDRLRYRVSYRIGRRLAVGQLEPGELLEVALGVVDGAGFLLGLRAQGFDTTELEQAIATHERLDTDHRRTLVDGAVHR